MAEITIIQIENKLINNYKHLQTLPITVQTKIKRYKRAENAYQCYIGELLRREMLSDYFNCLPNELLFQRNSFGKPIIKNVCFNVSHSESYVACIVDKELAGIDIQFIVEPTTNLIKLLHDREKQQLERSTDKKDSFNFFWTIREAYLKAIGTGFCKSSQSFWVKTTNKSIEIIDNEQQVFKNDNIISRTIFQDYKLSAISSTKEQIEICTDTELIQNYVT